MNRQFLPDRWKELAPLLDAALEHEIGDRPAFLDRACAGDTALRAETETLLAESERSDRLFARDAVERFAALFAEPQRRLPELVAGRYRIGRELGAGGMATVYLARDLKHDRDVALKVLRPTLADVIGATRFVEEVRVTAKLDHPHILTLIDSGEADGILFYVIPYVRGETLRAKLVRERQLSMEDALSITRQVAAALDYAHSQGVVHRDIKPENILLHEGEAVLADFGIALAVQEAAGRRITETGLSLGTPQYMSPEQAAGDRVIDGRSDVYSLAAVFYEMIAGEPPITGATKQAIVAKLLTEPPTKLRVIRSAMAESVERATDKALSKVPADRYATAGAFARALEAPVGSSLVVTARRWSTRRMMMALGVAAGVAAVALLALVARGWGKDVGVTLTDRRQITSTGHVAIPAISANGKTLAYRAANCGRAGCTYGVAVQDVGGTASQQLFDGASALYTIEWSPDSRHLLFGGTINPVVGTFLVSTLGGAPRRVSSYSATFFAGGDSLLSRRAPVVNENVWLFVSGLDGIARDSIHVAEPGEQLGFFRAVPGSKWIVVGVYLRFVPDSNIAVESRVIDRGGRVVSRTVLGHAGTGVQGHASSDALWVSPGGGAWARRVVLRIPLNSATGRLAMTIDTIYTGVHTGVAVTADGRSLVVDEGSSEFDLWGLDVSEVVRDVFPEQKRLQHSTSAINVRLSPNGKGVVIGRDLGRTSDGLQGWSTMPFGGGAETPLALVGLTAETFWSDDSTVAIWDRVPAGARLALVDVRTGVARDALVVRDPYPNAYVHVRSGGWVWVRGWSPEISIQLAADTAPRRIRLPAWYGAAFYADVSRDGRLVALSGSNAHTDSTRVSVLSLADGVVTPWFTTGDARCQVSWLRDGTLLVLREDTRETYSIYHLLRPGRAVKLGTIPRRVSSVSVSRDLKRAVVVERNYHGDAWMSKVVRR